MNVLAMNKYSGAREILTQRSSSSSKQYGKNARQILPAEESLGKALCIECISLNEIQNGRARVPSYAMPSSYMKYKCLQRWVSRLDSNSFN